jgi:precorrin-8X/cobalt-precorrin-8 methylmutase
MTTRFDHYIIVDWSAANTRKLGRDSIWICHRGPRGEDIENPPTRHAAALRLATILAEVAAANQGAIAGFDFPFGYPAGFAAGLGLGGPPWRAVWDEIARLLDDHEDNRNNRFEVAAEFNRRVSKGCFPFWGCPAGFKHEFLGPKHHRGHTDGRLAERRLIDCWMRGAQPCWKLAYTGSVGSQSLTGIPIVRALRDDARWAGRARIWPFETGLTLPNEAKIVFAEVWPSWWPVKPASNETKDAAQVRNVTDIFARSDQAGELATWFRGDPNISPAQRQIVETEEAWTLGVTAPRQRPIRVLEIAPHLPSTRVPPSPSPGLTRGLRGEGGSEGPLPTGSRNQGQTGSKTVYTYLRDPAAISHRSLALVRAEADLSRFPGPLRRIAARIAHAVGDVAILDDLAWSKNAVTAGAMALTAGAPILVDAAMVAAGISAEWLTAANEVLCFLYDPAVATIATSRRTTRSAAAVELWRPHLAGAVVVIGNAPTALFRLLEILAEGAAKPAVVLGFPVGFVGAAEAKAALAAFGNGLEFVTLHGRRGGSAVAAAAVNALAGSARVTSATARRRGAGG